MDKREEFGLEKTPEQEYDFNPNEVLEEEPQQLQLDFDFTTEFDGTEEDADAILEELLSDDFKASLGMDVEPAAEPADYQEPAPEEIPELTQEEASIPEPAFEVEPELGEEFTAAFEKDFPSEENPSADTAPADAPQGDASENPIPRRRRKLSKERIIKEVYLPPIIAGLTLILILCFVGSAIGRWVSSRQEEAQAQESNQAASSSALQQEAELLLEEAAALANGYDYDAALTKLDSFSGDKATFSDMLDAYAAYSRAKDDLKPIDDPASIANLSFHCLIADPSRAFINKDYGDAFNANYVTTDEFSKILNQLYANGYVLVDFDSFVVETTGEDGKVTYSTQPIYLPADKTPIMLTETLVNYETFSIDSDGDGEADAGGSGFASKLVVRNGKIVNEYVDANGNVLYGAYDLVPILEEFIEAHPDFCYRGARATLAVSGEDGVFGYRIMHSVKETRSEDYYNEQVAGAKEIAAALREAGYTIACYTYANVSYGTLSATKIQVDLDNWSKEVVPVLGKIEYLVYAKSSDISADGNYEGGNKYNVLKNEGFRYFISSANVPYAEVTVNYVRQSRIMVTGNQMTTSPMVFEPYFNPKEVLNDLRGG